MSTAQFSIAFFILFITLAVTIAATTINSFSTRNRDETDHLALLSFKSMIFHDPYGVLSSWNTSLHFCYWEGVTCGKRHRRVVSLELESRGLEGSLSPHVGNLTFLRNLILFDNTFQGKIPQELGRLSRLQMLGLAGNNFNGVIPVNLFSCSNLVKLSLAANNLDGNIPKEVGFLSQLEILYLGANKLTGDIPPSIYNLSLLTNLSLPENQLTGSLPPTLGAMLPRLQLLNLWGNQLTGLLPFSISNCSNLEVLELSVNKFYGLIPEELGRLSRLQTLRLSRNKFSGVIPANLSSCSNLVRLVLNFNNLVGNIPTEVSSLSQLEILYLGDNKLTGEIPPSIYNLSLLINLTLYANQLTGSLPPTLGTMLPHLQLLYLWGNQLTGLLPFSISNCSKLEHLNLAENKFHGVLNIDFSQLRDIKEVGLWTNNLGSGKPDEMKFIDSMANCNKLQALALYDNKFKGVLPSSIGNLSNQLSNLFLGSNQLFGSVPLSIANLVGLTVVSLDHNNFTGEIPPSIGTLQKLQILELSRNQFSGSIPDSIGNIPLLIKLHLYSNMLKGRIPSSLGNCQKLLMLDLSQNKLTGKIPKTLFQLSSLSIYLDLSQNNISGSLPSEVGQLKNLKQLDLSDNNLSGTIPSGFSGCTSLEILYIQGNLFQGMIPQSLSSLRGIVDLDLSRNNLSGYIPRFLEQLALQRLNLSSNDFEGEVPMKGVFANTSAFSVFGNKRLCGGLPVLGLTKCMTPNKSKTKFHVLVIVISCIVSVLLALSFLSAFAFSWHKKKMKGQRSESTRNDGLLRVSYGQLLKATNGFSTDNLIGVGGFSSVYKGILEESRIVAVKVLHLQTRVAYKSFEAECEIWRNIRHRNLLKVITSCSSVDFQGNEFKALVYEFMPNGSLDSWLHSTPRIRSLNLLERVSILVDVASALDYLHNHCQIPIVHCDLKPSNILLDEEMMAHVGDFGLAKFIEADASHNSSVGIRGTIGYTAPEYGLGSEMMTSGDVYSFGILLLEMMTGKRPTDNMFNQDLNLHKFICTALPDHVTDILDEVLLNFDQENVVGANDTQNTHQNAKKIEECLVSTLRIGVGCSFESPQDRMIIEDALHHLQDVQDALRNTHIGHA